MRVTKSSWFYQEGHVKKNFWCLVRFCKELFCTIHIGVKAIQRAYYSWIEVIWK